MTTFVELVKFEHTVFALPFALVGCLMASGGHPTAGQVAWIILAMGGARTAGMALNRVIDLEYDALNPRTANRTLPAGRMRVGSALCITVAGLALLLLAASHLSPLALRLSPLAVGLLALYSFLKRFTWMSHLGLGLVLACAPAGAWVAVRGSLDAPALLLAGAVLLWVAGFDILYGCLDVEFDRRHGLYSIPARFGIPVALRVAWVFHLACVLVLVGAGKAAGCGTFYQGGVGVVAGLLLYEHQLVEAHDLSRMDQAFFMMNGWVSVTLLCFTWLDFLVGQGGLR